MADESKPKDWDKLLNHFADKLSEVEETLAKAAAWEATESDANRSQACVEQVEEHATKHRQLDEKTAEVTRWVDAIESELRISEELLRVLLNQTESVRQSLATWAGRAIG